MYDKTLALARLDAARARIETLARLPAPNDNELRERVGSGLEIARELLGILLDAQRKPWPAEGDLLELWKILVKGEPHWNTIRDNCRELVYYQNCLDMDRRDALPPHPEKMLVHTLRHLYLYLRSHTEQAREEHP